MQSTIDFINQKIGNIKPEIGIILGSGLGDFAQGFPSVCIPYSEIPGFETSTVQGHAGQLVFTQPHASLSSHLSPLTSHLVMMQGRYHFYEGHSMEKVVYPVKVMKKLGVKTLIITNAAGAVNPGFKPADLMLITDHINFMGTNPLIGENDEALGTRFPDMSEVYKKKLIDLAQKSAEELELEVRKGVYAACSGPSYETPAEIRMLKTMGADAVGMSTVPEAIVANYCGMDVLGISCISNYAAGIQEKPLSHQEVIEVTNIAKDKFKSLILKIIEQI
ncbi:MAG: purine-nucleoside phosphorylase [Candidatus Gastranaerophilales bacterium]|nr:purine-nucleoside phosphorylase [Candidatus Gastranaerophilales bacterium]